MLMEDEEGGLPSISCRIIFSNRIIHSQCHGLPPSAARLDSHPRGTASRYLPRAFRAKGCKETEHRSQWDGYSRISARPWHASRGEGKNRGWRAEITSMPDAHEATLLHFRVQARGRNRVAVCYMMDQDFVQSAMATPSLSLSLVRCEPWLFPP